MPHIHIGYNPHPWKRPQSLQGVFKHMANFTKQAIVQAFLELLNERPFDKITVTDIAQRCGVSRNTFYYHFQDIFDLVDQMFVMETERLLSTTTSFDDWREGVNQAMAFARENRPAVYHLYNSANRERLERYLYDIFYGMVRDFIDTQSKDLDVRKQDADDLAMFYAAAFEGVTKSWIRDSMNQDSDYIANVSRMIEGSIRTALERSVATRQ